MQRRWVLGMLICLLPLSARADAIDMPVALGIGFLFFAPLLLFNVLVEAPILARLLSISISELWYPWLKANILSLLAGIPALILNNILGDILLPEDLQFRLTVYPWILLLFVVVYFAFTFVAEWIYLRDLLEKAEMKIPWKKCVKSVLIANLASYAVLGPLYFITHQKNMPGWNLTANAQWSSNATLTVVSINPKGQLEACQINGENHRILLPGPVADYVISEDFNQILYRTPKGQYYLQQGTTNTPLPQPGFECGSKYMDFSPAGDWVAFLNRNENRLLFVNTKNKQSKTATALSQKFPQTVVWSASGEFLLIGGYEGFFGISTNLAHSINPAINTDAALHYCSSDRSYMTWKTNRVMFWPNLLKPSITISLNDAPKSDIRLHEPTGHSSFQNPAFIDAKGEIVVQLSKTIYVANPRTRQIAPVMQGENFVVIAPTFLKSFQNK